MQRKKIALRADREELSERRDRRRKRGKMKISG